MFVIGHTAPEDITFRVTFPNLLCTVMNYLVRLNYLVLPRVRVRVRVSSVVVWIIQFPLFVGKDLIIQADQTIHHSKGGFPLRHYFARNKIGPFSIVVFREKLKKVEIFSTFFAEN